MRMFFRACILLSFCSCWTTGWAQNSQRQYEFSRLIIYDVRGSDREETILIFDQRGSQAKVWMKNYLGERRGPLPLEQYLQAFHDLQVISQYALKPEYRGKSLRAHAAHGTVTLAWEDASGKQIRTVHYYAPEHNLDTFRVAFNVAWALSRYAILSTESLESPNSAVREDALYFLSGSGWLINQELEDVMAFHRQNGHGIRIARAIWQSLDLSYAARSDFADFKYLEYCVLQCMVRLGKPAGDFLSQLDDLSNSKKGIAQKVLEKLSP